MIFFVNIAHLVLLMLLSTLKFYLEINFHFSLFYTSCQGMEQFFMLGFLTLLVRSISIDLGLSLTLHAAPIWMDGTHAVREGQQD